MRPGPPQNSYTFSGKWNPCLLSNFPSFCSDFVPIFKDFYPIFYPFDPCFEILLGGGSKWDQALPIFCVKSNHLDVTFLCILHMWSSSGGGALNFFQVGVCGPDFRSVGLANWYLPLKEGACELKISKFGGLWTENFPNLGAYELKISKFGACELKFWQKLRM